MEQVRAFIAIELPGEVKASLSRLQGQLKPGVEYVKWVGPEGIHLTLKFLGNIPASSVPQIEAAMDQVAKSVAPFRLQLTAPGAFPILSAPRVVWVGLGGDLDSLLQLQKAMEQALVPLRFTPEERAFSSHLTLGRVREKATAQERRRLGERMASLRVQEQLPLYVDKISLMRSELTARGAIYSRLASVRLVLPRESS